MYISIYFIEMSYFRKHQRPPDNITTIINITPNQSSYVYIYIYHHDFFANYLAPTHTMENDINSRTQSIPISSYNRNGTRDKNDFKHFGSGA